jgi:nucleotide-binding universal stress UspA family protein
MTYENVVVGSDGSATAAEVAANHGARLVIVTAYTPRRDDTARQSTVPDDIRWAVTDVNQAEERVRRGRQLASESGVTRTVTHAIAGSAADVLLDAAESFSADLIVVGSKGLTRTAGAILGSVAAAVVHHAPCDVMIVKTTD